ncbi:hypothetical protein DL546_006170 [Coniochaeta pulveracea]|uniref:Aldehyde dehydrogenase domain-containing protein n=1 Tax=Coniochaeta pulveracea TaxID=177199 RepID=A0A420Y6M6_9PEZI|nr:hypothetical protein DL546_006170 [Coniochaeta pulveracea]
MGSTAEDLHTVPFLIGGKEVHPEKSFEVVNPATGKVVHRCGAASEKEVKAAVEAASKAFKTWKNTTPKSRRDILFKAASVIERRKEELAGYMVAETGCSQHWAEFNLKVAQDLIVDVAGRLATIEGSFPATETEGVGALVLREPFGVVLAIAPWNAPYILGIRSVVFPLAAGNTVILKGTELAPRVMWAIADVLREAGVPDGAVNVLVHEPSAAAEITQSLIANPEIKKINFTGSTVVGRIIAKLAGENLKPVLLELGGKNPAIVWEDADLDLAAIECAKGSFLNSGQICMATDRILVHKKVRAEFEDKLKKAIDQIFGPQTEAPVLIHAPSVDKNKKLLNDAVSKGAKVLYGDINAEEPSKTRMRPVVISDVTPNMDIYQTESFGPSVALYDIETEEEALRIANDTEYGLSSAVFTEDLRRGLRFAKEIETGAVHINHMTVHDESALPHGGAKASGYGRFNSFAINEWVRTKTVTFKM